MSTLHNRVNNRELKERMQTSDEKRLTLSFYKYVPVAEPSGFRDQLYRDLQALRVLGRIYVSTEGINAQMSLPEAQLDAFRTYLDETGILQGVRLNIAIEDDGKSFFKLTVKVREKIVADGLDKSEYDLHVRGKHLSPEDFNTITENPETILVDMRNHYESEVGHFENAILPDVESFREALPAVADLLKEKKENPIVMYCTGGIRCEKASAYLKKQGFRNVYQLDGGIIEYARQVRTKALPNKFIGKNFVFDERLGERISPEVISACHQCGAPCDDHVNCANDACHLLFIQCPSCREKYAGSCSKTCQEFNALPVEVQRIERKHRVFNGSKAGKGRFPARRR